MGLLEKKNSSTKIGMSELRAIRIVLSKILLREKRIQLIWPLTLNRSFMKSLQALKNEAKHRVKPVKLRQTYEADYDDMPFFDDLVCKHKKSAEVSDIVSSDSVVWL